MLERVSKAIRLAVLIASLAYFVDVYTGGTWQRSTTTTSSTAAQDGAAFLSSDVRAVATERLAVFISVLALTAVYLALGSLEVSLDALMRTMRLARTLLLGPVLLGALIPGIIYFAYVTTFLGYSETSVICKTLATDRFGYLWTAITAFYNFTRFI